MTRLSIFFYTVLLVACSKQDNSSQIQLNGVYTGFFELDTTSFWCSISFGEGRYEEWPSGGAYYQKSMGCLSVGQYLISSDKLIFEMGSLKYAGFPNLARI